MTIYEGLSRHPVYMDHHATTPVDKRVLEAMLPYFTEIHGNAASEHRYGHEASEAVNKAREQIAHVIDAKPHEIIFTSGATESNNLALIGVAEKYTNKGKHIVTCQTEHKAVLDTCNYLAERGWQISCLPVDQQGLIDPDDVRRAITPETVLISIMAANNEIGVLAPLGEIGRIAREHEIFFHTDATQAVGHVPIDVQEMHIDLLSLSGHKIYGPKGIGALYVRSSRPGVRLAEQIHGGGHERNMRSGTLNVPGIVGLGKALEVAGQEMTKEARRLRQLRDRLWQGLKATIDGVELNGHPELRLPHNLNISIYGVQSYGLLRRLNRDVALSVGSACSTADKEAKVLPSHVIVALGYGEERAHSSLRFGLGRENTEVDVDFVIERVETAVKHLRRFVVV